MSSLQKIILGGFALVIVLLVYTDASKPEALNWYPSYTKEDKIPFGTYVSHQLLKKALNDRFEERNNPPYEVIQNASPEGTYFFLNEGIYFEDSELNHLLDWVSTGNDVFISAKYLGDQLLDTLAIEYATDYGFNTTNREPLLNLVNSKFEKETPYHLERNTGVTFFEKIDTLKHTVLGFSQVYDNTLEMHNPHVNYIKAPFGEGHFYLHLQPEVFTNYGMLHNTISEYSANALSYINTDKTVIWDNYYRNGKTQFSSPLRAILTNKNLKWAYYFVIIAVLLFVFFHGKRKQRSIPIVSPLKNRSLEYTQTISSMYIDNKEYHKIAEKQIILFKEYIRTHLRVPTTTINEDFFKQVAARSGNTVEDTKELFTFFDRILFKQETSSTALHNLYNKIKTFKNKVHGTS